MTEKESVNATVTVTGNAPVNGCHMMAIWNGNDEAVDDCHAT
jgi:hypothetical protein